MKRQILLILIMAVAVGAAACQPTPEGLYVQKKDGEKLIEIIEESDNRNQTENENPDNDKNQIDIEETWQEKIESNNGRFICYIDSNIIVPSICKFPAIKVTPYQFTAEDIKMYVNVLAPDAQLLVHGDGTPDIPLTKSEIETAILYLKKELNDVNSVLNKMKDKNVKHYEERKAITENELLELEEMYPNAPEKVEVEVLDITDDLMKQGFMATTKTKLRYNTEEEKPFSSINLKVSDCDVYGGRANGFSLTFSDKNQDSTSIIELQPSSFTLEDAIESAYSLLKDIGLETMKFSYSETQNNIYSLIFMRSYNEILTNYAEQDIDFDNPELPTYSIGWPNEKLTIQYNTNGFLKRVRYKYPLEEMSILNTEVNILSFNEIQNIFRQQIKNEGMWIQNEKMISRTYYIDTIKLGMARISTKDNLDEYIVVPVWDFYGYSVDKYGSPKDTQYALDENNEYISNTHPYSFLTINAIDGSIIDRSLGY